LSNSAPAITDSQFNFIRRLARTHAGIAIADFKRNMVRRRVSKRLNALGISDLEEYCDLLTGPQGEKEIQPLINALTTNKTEFFRESHHFEHMRSVALPKFLERCKSSGSRRIRIWSAGCSSGEEPYSIAMTLCDCLADIAQWDIKVLATDIDTEILSRARNGLYKLEDIESLPTQLRAKYVTRQDSNSEHYSIAPCVRNLIVYKRLNLHEPWPMKGPFDIIFCRNVVIYFDKPTQRSLYDRFANIIASDGYLYCGHSESLFGLSVRFEPSGKSIYEKIS
jgi:chemotaxis protein methyltransferase CheR